MRESNFAFPAQNRACVCISSQLYDRRALDTNSALPLLNSLTHLTYLTSTSPRIREILTCDGGLERLVRLLRDFCLAPPPPESPSAIYGLAPPGLPRPPPTPVLNPKNYDRHAAYRFSLAFQCVVNIGVRGSEPIRSRVVQAGTLDVVGCVLEAWLAAKGFAVGPAASASGIPRESREARALRRQRQAEQQQREQAQQLVRRLARETQLIYAENNDDEDVIPSSNDELANGIFAGDATEGDTEVEIEAESSISTDTSANATPLRAQTPAAGAPITTAARDRSGTVIARRDVAQPTVRARVVSRQRTIRARAADEPIASSSTSASTSRPETETEDDGDGYGDNETEGESYGDGDVEMGSQEQDEENIPPPRRMTIIAESPSPSPAPGQVGATNTGPVDIDVDAHIIINTPNVTDDGPLGGVSMAGMAGMGGMGGGVDDGLVGLDGGPQGGIGVGNDDLAMGAPPGAPGAIEATPRTRTNTLTLHPHGHSHGREELTPRAGLASLPHHSHGPMPVSMQMTARQEAGPSVIAQQANVAATNATTRQTPQAAPVHQQTPGHQSHRHHSHHHHHHAEEPGPFREEDVLLSLQLLAYLSKYPHVRQAFYKPRLSFHPVTAQLQMGAGSGTVAQTPAMNLATPSADFANVKKELGFFKTFTGRGKDKAPLVGIASAGSSFPLGQSPPAPTNTTPMRTTNVFSLVERFTFRPSPTESNLQHPPPFLPQEIQYWAGVIMRNACRKDESRGGIRQCANMLCGKWESFPREFAKCRRCRKAKYCGKECQSRAWSEGHRFWCSAREGDEAADSALAATAATDATALGVMQEGDDDASAGGDGLADGAGRTATGRTQGEQQERLERRMVRERERVRQRMAAAAVAAVANMPPNAAATRVAEAAAAAAARSLNIPPLLTTHAPAPDLSRFSGNQTQIQNTNATSSRLQTYQPRPRPLNSDDLSFFPELHPNPHMPNHNQMQTQRIFEPSPPPAWMRTIMPGTARPSLSFLSEMPTSTNVPIGTRRQGSNSNSPQEGAQQTLALGTNAALPSQADRERTVRGRAERGEQYLQDRIQAMDVRDSSGRRRSRSPGSEPGPWEDDMIIG